MQSLTRLQQRAVATLQLALTLTAVYFLTRAVLAFLSPESLWDAPKSMPISAVSTGTTQAARLDPRFDPFHRDTAVVDEIIEIGTDAPETTLNIKLFGRRAGKNGSAILQASDNTQKVFRIGDEIMNGVTLKAVHPDYIVLSQGGRIERLTFERDNENLLAAPELETAEFATPITAVPKTMTVESLMAGVTLAPAVNSGTLTGFRISPKNGSIDLSSLGLRSGDVIAAIDDIDLTAPSLNPAQLPSKLAGKSKVRLTVLRGNKTVFVNLGQ